MNPLSDLSDYEKLREANIRRNASVIQQLGIQALPAQRPLRKRPVLAKKNDAGLPSPPRRTSLRKRKHVSSYAEEASAGGAFVKEEKDDDSDDDGRYEGVSGASDDEHDWSALPPPRKSRKVAIKKENKIEAAKSEGEGNNKENSVGGIVCEMAKTGRSTCRKCGSMIAKGAPRVGMQAWIAGRQSITWQCPACFLGNLSCAHDASGRGRCKMTKQKFTKGELKLGARSHTATNYYSVDAVGQVLEAVALHMPRNEWGNAKKNLLQVDFLEGSKSLCAEDRAAIQLILDCTASKLQFSSSAVPAGKHSEVCSANATTSGNMSSLASDQPKTGSRSGCKGRVEWKWGSTVCSGMLMPSKETLTHCYAKTHKGNVKTLAKEKDYWWVATA
jgi:hypothetical protein